MTSPQRPAAELTPRTITPFPSEARRPYTPGAALGGGLARLARVAGVLKKLELRLHPAGAAARLVLARQADGGGHERANPWLLSRGSRERPCRVHGLRAHG